jgi:hypothetical protein
MHWCFITAFNDFLKATHVRQKTRVLRQKTRVLRQKTRVLQQNVKIYSLVFTILACAWQLQKKVLWLIICRLSGNNRPITDYLKNGRLIDYLPINRLIPNKYFQPSEFENIQ